MKEGDRVLGQYEMPVKFQFAVEYSVVSQDDFGKKALIKLNVIPVIPALIKEPLFWCATPRGSTRLRQARAIESLAVCCGQRI